MRHISSIYKFDFTDWNDIPYLLSDLDKKTFSREEGHILSAIKLAYYAIEGGRKEINKKAGKIGLIGLVSLITLITFVSLATHFDRENSTGTVNAATISATFKKFQQGNGMEIVESTMSAMFAGK